MLKELSYVPHLSIFPSVCGHKVYILTPIICLLHLTLHTIHCLLVLRGGILFFLVKYEFLHGFQTPSGYWWRASLLFEVTVVEQWGHWILRVSDNFLLFVCSLLFPLWQIHSMKTFSSITNSWNYWTNQLNSWLALIKSCTVKCHYNACHYNANASLTRSILGSQTAPTCPHDHPRVAQHMG